MQFTESVISVCFNTSLLKYGGDIAVGSMTILTSVMQFSMLPLQGLTQGAQPIVSFNYGANNIHRVKNSFPSVRQCRLEDGTKICYKNCLVPFHLCCIPMSPLRHNELPQRPTFSGHFTMLRCFLLLR